MKTLLLDCAEGISDIIPVAIGKSNRPIPEAYDKYLNDFYIMHICLSGVDVIRINGEKHSISAGQMFVSQPCQNIMGDREGSECYIWVAFGGSRPGKINMSEKIKKTPSGVAHHLIDLMEAKEKSPDIYISIILEVLYNLFTKTSPDYDKIAEVRNYIKDNSIGFMTVNDIAAKFGFERSYLHRIFKQRYGISIKKFITDTKMMRAKTMLEEGSSVLEVSYKVGYSSEFNFSRAFKQYYGIAPSMLKNESNYLK